MKKSKSPAPGRLASVLMVRASYAGASGGAVGEQLADGSDASAVLRLHYHRAQCRDSAGRAPGIPEERGGQLREREVQARFFRLAENLPGARGGFGGGCCPCDPDHDVELGREGGDEARVRRKECMELERRRAAILEHLCERATALERKEPLGRP